MVTILELDTRLKKYLLEQINTIAKDNPFVGFVKPLITRAVDKNFSKVKNMLSLIADQEGNIDVENILTEMFESVVQSNTFTINTGFIGGVIVGDGIIKMQIPMTNKNIVFNMSDLQHLKEVLTAKS